MNVRGTSGRLVAGLAAMSLLGGCASGAGPVPATPAPATLAPAPASVPTVATPGPTTSTATPRATPSVVVTRDVAYQTDDPDADSLLDVYAPAKAGAWPVVVLLHGGPPLSKQDYASYARMVADLGFVVFVPTWGVAGTRAPTYGGLVAAQSNAACAVAFAREHAPEYDGDPATMIVFGHSAGANMAALVAFARPAPRAGCLAEKSLGRVDALVTWEGDWMAFAPGLWDEPIVANPRVMDGYTPLSYLANDSDLRVVMLVSENPGIERDMSDAATIDAFFAVRDPSGNLRRQLDANGVFADGRFDVVELQQLLFSILEAQGNPVSLDVMPGSTHTFLSDAGTKVFLAAFAKAAARD